MFRPIMVPGKEAFLEDALRARARVVRSEERGHGLQLIDASPELLAALDQGATVSCGGFLRVSCVRTTRCPRVFMCSGHGLQLIDASPELLAALEQGATVSRGGRVRTSARSERT